MSDGLRVLMVGAYPEREGVVVGGVQAATQALARALSSNPNVEQVLVIAPPRDGSGRDMRENDRLEIRFARTNGRMDLFRRSAPFRRELKRIAKDFKPHVVHAQGLDRVGRAATGLGLPSVVTIHGHLEAEARLAAKTAYDYVKLALIQSLTKGVLRRVDVLISISDYDKRFYGDFERKFHSIPNGISSVFFDRDRPSGRDATLLFAGMVSERKNIIGLIESFDRVAREVPDATLNIAGEAWDKAYLQKVNSRIEASPFRDRIHLIGHLSTPQLIDEMLAAAVFVLFSDEENAPIVISQAMALGLPVVATAVGGVAKMLESGGGFATEPRDDAAFARACLSILNSADRGASIGQAGAEIARQTYSPARVAELTVQAYRDAINRHHAKR